MVTSLLGAIDEELVSRRGDVKGDLRGLLGVGLDSSTSLVGEGLTSSLRHDVKVVVVVVVVVR